MNFLWKTLIVAAGVAGTAGAGVWAYKWITKDKSANDEPNKPPEKAADSGKTQDQQPVHELATVAVRNDKKDAQVQVGTENTGVVDEENKKLKEEVHHLKSKLSAEVAVVEEENKKLRQEVKRLKAQLSVEVAVVKQLKLEKKGQRIDKTCFNCWMAQTEHLWSSVI